ncbi:hypothetical protein [Sphingomonas sp. YR710]|uniref:hypothetical protein n=1 Tax=Sphingomonas sp. YR710 TaxID=1882773 RepID=UPI00210D1DC3|nr:hypothetical protein [Sphingomonas sp. YR710]
MRKGLWPGAALAAIMLGAAMIQARAYWPGIMIYDAIRQYGQALSGHFDDWHPPAFEWLWRRLLPIASGPTPMLVLQILLYWSGFALLASWAMRGRRPWLAFGIAACATLPIPFALLGAVLKDSLMAGLLLTVTGLLAWSQSEDKQQAHNLTRIAALLLLLCAATLRFNAFFAGLPLALALMPAGWRSRPRRFVMVALALLIPLLLAPPFVNRALRAERSGVELSLIIYDLGGITRYSGVDVFPPLGIADPVAVNARCYSSVNWDPYAWWGPAPCPIGFDLIRARLKASGESPYRLWVQAIAAHPIAYAEHRLGHFNANTHFLIDHDAQRAIPAQSDPNPWNQQVPPNRLFGIIDSIALWSATWPIGWPICWIALALGTLAVAPSLPSRRIIIPLAASSAAYGLGYLLVSVASETRYHLWTMSAAAIAAVIAAADMAIAPVARRRLLPGLAPLMIVTVLGCAWRI